MKKFILILFLLLCFAVPSSARMIIGSGAAGSTGWSDNFTGSDNDVLEDRTGWVDLLGYADNEAKTNQAIILSNEVRFYDSSTDIDYILASYAPLDADYSVQCTTRLAATQQYWFPGPAVRASTGATTFVGYYIRITEADNTVEIRKKLNGANSVLIGSAVISDVTWTNTNTFKLTVSGSTTTDLALYINGTSRVTGADSTSPITAAGNGGLIFQTESGQYNYVDNFEIVD